MLIRANDHLLKPRCFFDIIVNLEKESDKMTNPQTIEFEDIAIDTGSDEEYRLIVWNDEVNTFDWVIETLIDVCGHTPEQAEQCALLIHTQGKYAVKVGMFETLKPMCDKITERGIGATVESVPAI